MSLAISGNIIPESVLIRVEDVHQVIRIHPTKLSEILLLTWLFG